MDVHKQAKRFWIYRCFSPTVLILLGIPFQLYVPYSNKLFFFKKAQNIQMLRPARIARSSQESRQYMFNKNGIKNLSDQHCHYCRVCKFSRQNTLVLSTIRKNKNYFSENVPAFPSYFRVSFFKAATE